MMPLEEIRRLAADFIRMSFESQERHLAGYGKVSVSDWQDGLKSSLHAVGYLDHKIFTRSEAMQHTGWAKTRLHTHLTELMDMELVVKQSGKQNCLQTYKLLYNGEGTDGRKFCIGFNPVQ